MTPCTTRTLIVLLAIAATPPAAADELAPLRALEKAYVDAWTANDEAAVMETISRDAVIVPSRLPPIRGIDKIRAFWFPDDGSTTTITHYATTILSGQVTGDIGWLLGTGELSFTWEKEGERLERSQTSTFTMIARRENDGRWRIVHRMWTDTSP